MPGKATQDGWVKVKSSDKTWSTGGRNGNTLQSTRCKNPMNSMKSQSDMTPEYEPLGQKVSNMLPGKSKEQLLIAPERMKQPDQSGTEAQLWMCLVMKVKYDAIKNSTT